MSSSADNIYDITAANGAIKRAMSGRLYAGENVNHVVDDALSTVRAVERSPAADLPADILAHAAFLTSTFASSSRDKIDWATVDSSAVATSCEGIAARLDELNK